MKKYVALTILLTLLSGMSYADEVIANPSDIIFRSSLTDIVQDVSDPPENHNDIGFREIDPARMPFFKQMRLRLTNKYLDVTTREERAKANNYNYTPKWKFWDKNRGQYIPIAQAKPEVEEDSEIREVIDAEAASPVSDLSFQSGINTEVTEHQLILDADNFNFDDETGDMIATGRPILELPPQNTTVIADVMTYNEDGNILKGIDNVVVTKDGKPLLGNYLEIDMNEETMFMDKLVMKSETMNMRAERATQKEGLVILNNGSIYSDKSSISRIATQMTGPRFEDMIVAPEAKALFFSNPEGNNLSIHIDSINIDARKNHDIFKIKNAKFYHKDKYLFRIPRMTAYTNKQHDYFEGNYPEFGSRPKVGMYAGPGITFSGPVGSVIKVIPFVNYKNKFGIGGMLKYVNTNNRTELGYASANKIFFLKGDQKLDDHLHLQYAANSYTDEWFLGGRMAKYMAEIYYDNSYLNKNFLAKNMDLIFRHRASFGLMQDDDQEHHGEKFSRVSNMSTTRTRYMAELNQVLYQYVNEERRVKVNAGIALQGSAALYGTGDTQFIARVGPQISMQYKNWMQNIGYFMSGYNDQSPMPRYDAYRYGKQSLYIHEALRLNKYISVGWAGNINLSDDTPNGKMFQENAFILSLGPDDFKILLGYDFVRERTYFGFNVAFDTKGTNITYDKMIIRNPERLGQQEGNEVEEVQVAFAHTKPQQEENKLFSKNTKQVLQYAQVIELEDPDKERID